MDSNQYVNKALDVMRDDTELQQMDLNSLKIESPALAGAELSEYTEGTGAASSDREIYDGLGVGDPVLFRGVYRSIVGRA
jgi:hypothetical protein